MYISKTSDCTVQSDELLLIVNVVKCLQRVRSLVFAAFFAHHKNSFVTC